MRCVLVCWCPMCGGTDFAEADGPGGLALRCKQDHVIAVPLNAVLYEEFE